MYTLVVPVANDNRMSALALDCVAVGDTWVLVGTIGVIITVGITLT